MPLQVSCPHCQTQVSWIPNNEFRPFCSKRCQLIDLGEWADEGHKISQSIQVDTVLSEEMLDTLEDELLMNDTFFVEPE